MPDMRSITYRTGNSLNLDEVIELYRASTLGERRPIENRDIVQSMISHADLVVTAWDGEQLVGIARTLTDFSYVAYLADLAVHRDYQRQGIGKNLLEETKRQLDDTCMITLLAAPAANAYYSKLGFEHNPRAWMLKPNENPSS
jgi:GNAT superfamily N-acetyltransferase